MNIWKMEDIKGFILDGKHICPACINDEEMGDVATMQIFSRKQLEDSGRAIYCDRCGARL